MVSNGQEASVTCTRENESETLRWFFTPFNAQDEIPLYDSENEAITPPTNDVWEVNFDTAGESLGFLLQP